MTIEDPQRSRCVELRAELGEAFGEVKESSSAELDNFVAKLRITPFAQLHEASSEANSLRS